jgi:hypothetical protein
MTLRLSVSREQLWQYVAAAPWTHAGYTIAKDSFRYNSAVQRLVSRRDGFVSADGDYTTGVGLSHGGARLNDTAMLGQLLPSVTTVPLAVPSCSILHPSGRHDGDLELRLNVVTSVAGFVAVELRAMGQQQLQETLAAGSAILADADSALPGFALDEAVPIKGNFISRAAEWRNGDLMSTSRSLRALAGREVHVHVVLAAAQLFSLEFVCVSSPV